MKLDQYQRLTLIYQLLQLEHLDKEYADDYRVTRLALEDGHECLYEHIFSNRLRNGLSPEGYQEVEDILQMFLNIQQACETLPKGHGLNLDLLQFRGFPQRGEPIQHSYARYLLKTERFDELECRTTPQFMLPRYRRMLQAWEKYSEQLTVDDLRSIQDAAMETNVRPIVSNHKRRVRN